MSLAIQFHGPEASPCVVCDVCGKPIVRAEAAVVAWDVPQGHAAPQAPLLAHRWCALRASHTHPRQWADLALFVALLARTMRMDLPAAVARAARLESL